MANNGSGTKRKTRSEVPRNRQALIEAAREVFAEEGLNVALGTIAKRAGLGSATLYRYFPTRESLALEAFRLNLRRHLHQIESAQNAATGQEGFARYMQWLFREQLQDKGLADMLLTVRRGLDAEVDSLRQITLDGIEALIDRAKAEGDFRQDRWLDDALLYLDANARFAKDGGGGVASARLYELMIDSFAAAVPDDVSAEPPPSVLAVRAGMAHRRLGIPSETD